MEIDIDSDIDAPVQACTIVTGSPTKSRLNGNLNGLKSDPNSHPNSFGHPGTNPMIIPGGGFLTEDDPSSLGQASTLVPISLPISNPPQATRTETPSSMQVQAPGGFFLPGEAEEEKRQPQGGGAVPLDPAPGGFIREDEATSFPDLPGASSLPSLEGRPRPPAPSLAQNANANANVNGRTKPNPAALSPEERALAKERRRAAMLAAMNGGVSGTASTSTASTSRMGSMSTSASASTSANMSANMNTGVGAKRGLERVGSAGSGSGVLPWEPNGLT